jgi:hypothetical protein
VDPVAASFDERDDDDVKRALKPAEDPHRFPRLAALLAGQDGETLRRELAELVGPSLRLRAPRRYVRVLCRLRAEGYDEPVLLTDVSESGVRFLVQADVPLDLTRAGRMTLSARTTGGARDLVIALVRRCGGDERHTDLACRFLEVAPDHTATVTELRSLIFGEA